MGQATPQSVDTSLEVSEIVNARIAEMTHAERAQLANEMSMAIATLEIAGIRSQFPEASEEFVRYQLLVRRYGSALADEVRDSVSP